MNNLGNLDRPYALAGLRRWFRARRRMVNLAAIGLAWGLAGMAPLGGTASAGDALVWRSRENKVDAQIEGWKLKQMLENLAAVTGWSIYVEPGTEHTIWARFQNLNPGEALGRLLGDLNYALLPQTNAHSKLFVFRTAVHEATQLIQATPQKPATRASNMRIPNELLVVLKPGSKEKINELAARLGAKIVGRMDDLNAYRLRFESADAADAARSQLEANTDVNSVENNYAMRSPTQMEPLALSSMAPLNLKPNVTPDPHQLVIGLVDTTVQPQAVAQIKDFLLPGISVAGEATSSATSPTHGTSMAETILRAMSLAPQSPQGVSTRILPIDVYGGNDNTSTFDVAKGVYTAIKKGATLINLSLGGPDDSPLLHQVIQDGHQQGVVFTAAAGNEPTTAPTYPAAYSEVVAATAGDRQGNIAPYANRGSFVSVVAPGGNIIYFDNQAYLVNGTSVSSAFTAGMIAGQVTSSGKSVLDAAGEVTKQMSLKANTKP